MKIIWHSMTPLANSEMRTGYARALDQHLSDVSREGTEFEMMGTKVGEANIYRSLQTFNKRDALLNLLELVDRDDVDAVAMGNANDPVVSEAREVLDVPVTGLTETTLLLSYMLSEEVAVVAESDKLVAKMRNHFARYELDERVTGIYGLDGVGVDVIHRAYAGDEEGLKNRKLFVEEFSHQVRNSVRDGAEAVIPGGNILAVLLNKAGVDELHGVPILDKTGALVKVTETMVDLYEIGAVSTSRKGSYRPPPPEEFDELLSAYGVR